MTLPDTNVLPAPLWLITPLHILTLSMHFAAMNFLLGGIVLVLSGTFGQRWQNPTIRRFVRLFPTALAATVTLGVAPLLFLQLVYPAQMYSAAIVSGWFWLMIIPAVILAYCLLYGASFSSKGESRRTARYLWPAVAALIYVSLVYSSVFSMAERPELIKNLYVLNQTGLRWNPQMEDYLLRWLHMVLGAVTVGGFFAGMLGRDDPEAFPIAKRMFTFGMAAAAAAGLAYLMSLGNILPALMRTPAIWALTAGILLSGGALHFFYKRRFIFAGLALFISLITMVAARHQVRLLRLHAAFDPASWKIAPQWLPFLIFAACFLAAFAIIFYMLRLFFRDETSGDRRATPLR